jgi:hypothetical protein
LSQSGSDFRNLLFGLGLDVVAPLMRRLLPVACLDVLGEGNRGRLFDLSDRLLDLILKISLTQDALGQGGAYFLLDALFERAHDHVDRPRSSKIHPSSMTPSRASSAECSKP